MSETNAQSLRTFLEAFQDVGAWVEEVKRGDADLSGVDPDVVYEDDTLPDHIGESYRGHAGILRAAERWAEPFEAVTLELQRIVGSGDRFVSFHAAHTKARHSGIEFDLPLAYAWTFRDGKVVHFRSFRDPNDALEAAGLSE
jgi:ketosteroid isomerase-like protein